MKGGNQRMNTARGQSRIEPQRMDPQWPSRVPSSDLLPTPLLLSYHESSGIQTFIKSEFPHSKSTLERSPNVGVANFVGISQSNQVYNQH